MTDSLSPEKRSWNMSRIHGSNTSIEIKVRKYLFSQGFRYRKNDKRYAGKPDIVLPKYRTVIFIHGCFWHRHPNCKNATMPKTRTVFWQEKLNKNIENDAKNVKSLTEDGWKVIILWECEIRHNFESLMKATIDQIKNNTPNE